MSAVDTNGNGQVTIQEAKDAGYAMPIYSDHWLYPHIGCRFRSSAIHSKNSAARSPRMFRSTSDRSANHNHR